MGAVTFIKQDIRKNDAGNYTCMYGNENPGDVKNISHGSSVYLSVQGVEFSIKKVKRSDTGNYTCVYGKEKLVNSANSKRSRPVYLHVTALYLGAGVGSGVLVLLLLLIGGVLKCLKSKRGIGTRDINWSVFHV
ncbi:UNVERIFIED_CONTAM: hypothetical protein FKN15_005713 [Acipenser sinensis]